MIVNKDQENRMFEVNQKVQHRKNLMFYIITARPTSDVILEYCREPFYEYKDCLTGQRIIRRQSEMEDGRFIGLELIDKPEKENIRDPLIDPQSGDRVRARDKTRLVLRRSGNDIYYTVEGQKNASEKNCWITTWQDWCCKHNAVVVTDN